VPFPHTLTTMAFDHSSLRWFEAFPCRTASKGLPSSFVQLRTGSGSIEPFRCARGATYRKLRPRCSHRQDLRASSIGTSAAMMPRHRSQTETPHCMQRCRFWRRCLQWTTVPATARPNRRRNGRRLTDILAPSSALQCLQRTPWRTLRADHPL